MMVLRVLRVNFRHDLHREWPDQSHDHLRRHQRSQAPSERHPRQ